jgi:VWFA-related protein
MILVSTQKVLALAIGWALIGADAHGQATAPTPNVVETAHVNVVNVEAFVAGTDGRPIRGLHRGDFELLEDGKPVIVTNFTEFAGTEPAPGTATPPSGEQPPAAPPVETAGEQPGPQTPAPEEMLSLVVYVDNANISLVRRNEVFGHLRRLLPSLLTGGRTQIMLVSGGSSVRIRQPFTANEGELTASLDSLQHEAAEGGGSSGADTSMISRAMDRTSMEDGSGGRLTPNSPADEINSLLVQARAAAEAEYERTRAILGVMSQFVSSLSGLPGRKVMFYVGKGLPMRPGEEMLQKFEARYANSGVAPGFSAATETSRFNMTELFRTLTRKANAGQVTIYCVEATGDGGRGANAEQTTMTADPSVQTGGGMGLRQSLDIMAGATGGLTISSGAGIGLALARAMDDVGSSYSLGFAPPHGHDGVFHTLKVRVKREGVSVRAREGYLDASTDDRMAARSLSGLLFNVASNPLAAAISVRPEGQAKGNLYAVTVLVTIPLEKLMLQPHGDGHEASVSLWFASLDSDNRVNQAKKQVFPVHIPNDKLLTALGQAAGYTFHLTLHKGQHRVAVSLRDDFGETESTLTTTFGVGEDTGGPGPS